MKRILALDGGGIRGIFSLQILKRIERLFRDECHAPGLVLADVFDFFAGTSTGAIIATGLCWGMAVDDIERLYLQYGSRMFTRSPWFTRWKAKYRAEQLAAVLRDIFFEDDDKKSPALLGSPKLRKLLLAVMRNATTGSAWPVTNNPRAKYNDPALPGCNLQIPLWQLIRASTAAPTFFAPERIDLGGRPYLFVDGAITPFNNPALIAVLTATLPCYHIAWPATRESLHVVSVGTGHVRSLLAKQRPQQVHLLDMLHHVPPALLGASAVQQDMLCRVLGDCVYGAPIDTEIGDLTAPSLLHPGEQKFTYVRYDMRLDVSDGATILPARLKATIDDLRMIPMLQAVGQEYAARHVALEHLFPRAGIHERGGAERIKPTPPPPRA